MFILRFDFRWLNGTLFLVLFIVAAKVETLEKETRNGNVCHEFSLRFQQQNSNFEQASNYPYVIVFYTMSFEIDLIFFFIEHM